MPRANSIPINQIYCHELYRPSHISFRSGLDYCIACIVEIRLKFIPIPNVTILFAAFHIDLEVVKN